MFKIGESYQKECSACTLSEHDKREMCAICTAQKIVRGKWKLVVVWLLRDGPMRFSELRKAVPNIKQGPLSIHLKELESIGVVHRESFNEVPPRVEYSLTRVGLELLVIVNLMKDWSSSNLVTFGDLNP